MKRHTDTVPISFREAILSMLQARASSSQRKGSSQRAA